jgi:ribonuclease HI
MATLYTDGSCVAGTGGGGLLLFEEQTLLHAWGYQPGGTPQRMELRAVIEGLLRTPPGAQVLVHTDSDYVLLGVTRGGYASHADLWAVLARLLGERSVRFHSHPRLVRQMQAHRRAHLLAGAAARRSWSGWSRGFRKEKGRYGDSRFSSVG